MGEDGGGEGEPGALTTGDQGVDGFLWHNGKMTDLPPIGGAAFATAESVNNRDEVVGVLYDSNGNEISAFLWTGGHGYDLNTLVAPSDFQIISADYINNRGDIFGHGVLPNGDQRVFLLIRNPSILLSAAAPATKAPHVRTARTAPVLARRCAALPTAAAAKLAVCRWKQ